MKTFIFNIAILVSLLMGINACSEVDNEIPSPSGKGTVRLVLSSNKSSRAVDPGVDNLNENKIEKAYFFFFQTGETDQPYEYRTPSTLTPASDSSVTLTIPSGALSMDGTTKYDIYVIANATFTDDSQLDGKTLNELKALPVAELTEEVQSSFIMDGMKEAIAFNKDDSSIGTIDLERAAAKISLEITVEKDIVIGKGTSGETHYTPILADADDENKSLMTVSMYNRVKNGLVNGSVATPEMLPAGTRTIKEGSYGHVPFYSYPSAWEKGDDTREAYLTLRLSWKNENTGSILPYSYRIPVNDASMALLRNHHYRIKLHVGMLGSLEGVVPLTPEYIIENWSEVEITDGIKKYQYLWVKDYNVKMNNVDAIDIEYASSSKIEFVDISVQRYSPLDETGRNNNNMAERLVKIDSLEVSFTANEDGTFTVKHEIDPVTKNDYRPWYIKFKVKNQDGLTSEEITVIQYPAIYAVGNYNEKGTTNRFVNGDAGYTNGSTASYQVFDDTEYQLGTLNDLTNTGPYATNRNRNQYKIYVTVLDEGDDSRIGDPRTKEENNFSGLGLTHYHPASSSENTNKIIAPSFLIASSWGITQPVYEAERAQRRCAAYQENGYPAGRWRLPTEAEIKFVQKLSDGDYIPALFEGYYWASSGNLVKSNNVPDNAKNFVRCVYDLWYWGDEPMYDEKTGGVLTTFTWGDDDINIKKN